MASANITGGTADGRLTKASDVSWAACLLDTPAVATTSTYTSISRQLSTGVFGLNRAFFCFDVSPYQGRTITAATLKLHLAAAAARTPLPAGAAPRVAAAAARPPVAP